ncbi:MAG: peroxiredoxin-like family protein [Casimicrobiaceae bacterium]
MQRVMPRQPVPALEVPTIDGATWRLADQKPDNFTLIVFYRGFHCPICKVYVKELDDKLDEFSKRGVGVLALSSDNRERAEKTRSAWGLERLTLGYGLSIESARDWGLYVSRAIKDTEPAEFAEPGLFLVKPDRTLYCSSVNTMPFARPSFDQVLGAISFVTANNYPARGEA